MPATLTSVLALVIKRSMELEVDRVTLVGDVMTFLNPAEFSEFVSSKV